MSIVGGIHSSSPAARAAQVGLAAARARGRCGGRKPKLDDKQVREIKALLRDPDIQVADVARRYGVSRTTLYKHVGVVSPRLAGGARQNGLAA